MVASHLESSRKLAEAKSALLELYSTKGAQTWLLNYANFHIPLHEGIILGMFGDVLAASNCADKCLSKYEKGMIYASCGAKTADLAEQQLSFLALVLQAGGLDVSEELIAKVRGFKLLKETSELLIKRTCEEGGLLALAIDSLDPKISLGWATVLFSQGFFVEAGLLAAKAEDRGFAVKCIVELNLKARVLFDEKAKRQTLEYCELIAGAGIILAEIGNYDEARKKATMLRGRPLLQGLVLARCKNDAASKSAAWDIAFGLLEGNKNLHIASEIFTILEDAPRAVAAALRAPVLPVFRPFALLRAAKVCQISISVSSAACKKIEQSIFEQIVMEAKLEGDELLLGKLMVAAPKKFADAVENLQLKS